MYGKFRRQFVDSNVHVHFVLIHIVALPVLKSVFDPFFYP
jgi:hypothetical protein